MDTIITKRTQSVDRDFHDLVAQLDHDLNNRYRDAQSQYDNYNRIDSIDTVVVAYDKNRPVGCGCFKRYDDETVEIKRVFVVPDYRGRKISRLILGELEKWARELGYARAILETGLKQTEAIGLYERSGYVKIENYGQYKGFSNSVCFEKRMAMSPCC